MDDKQNELTKILKELSEPNRKVSENNFNEYINRLENVYERDFRHLYSGLFGTITMIDDNEQYDLVKLTENIGFIYSQINSSSGTDCKFKDKIKKLYDHVNLDVARIEYTKRIADKITEKNTETNMELKKIGEKAESMQKEYITILGIFSSIVVTFVAGMVFSTSVLSNIDKVSIYRLVFVMLLIALMLFNLLGLLLEFIEKINGRVDTNININGKKKSSTIASINCCILVLMIIDFISWLIYWYRFLD